MIVSVPDRPSTPSLQFVTLMDTHTSTTVRMPKITGGIVILPPKIAKSTTLLLKFRNVTATMTAIAKSRSPFLSSPHGALEQSSRNPVIMAAANKTR